jgi:hypothetical protein
MTDELVPLPAVVAVAIGGSRAQDSHLPDSDWDFALYYRGDFDPGCLRAKGWPGQVSEIGGWGGGVMNGGAWLTIDGRRVDIHYRDLTNVEHWCAEAEAGRFKKELLLFYVAGIPTYVVMAELAINRVLSGHLPRVEYPDLLASEAGRRWHADAALSLDYAVVALERRTDPTVALANASRGLIEAAHSVLAYRHQWVLNEKGIVARAGLRDCADRLVRADREETLSAALTEIRQRIAGPVGPLV